MRLAVTIVGPDAEKAFNELVSNAQYERLDVVITKVEIDRDSVNRELPEQPTQGYGKGSTAGWRSALHGLKS